jgi:hypothetical protein
MIRFQVDGDLSRNSPVGLCILPLQSHRRSLDNHEGTVPAQLQPESPSCLSNCLLRSVLWQTVSSFIVQGDCRRRENFSMHTHRSPGISCAGSHPRNRVDASRNQVTVWQARPSILPWMCAPFGIVGHTTFPCLSGLNMYRNGDFFLFHGFSGLLLPFLIGTFLLGPRSRCLVKSNGPKSMVPRKPFT